MFLNSHVSYYYIFYSWVLEKYVVDKVYLKHFIHLNMSRPKTEGNYEMRPSAKNDFVIVITSANESKEYERIMMWDNWNCGYGWCLKWDGLADREVIGRHAAHMVVIVLEMIIEIVDMVDVSNEMT